MPRFEITWLEDQSDEAVLDEIRRVAALEPGRRLTVAQFDSLAKIKSTAVRDRFGSWSEATRRAGLSDAMPIYSKDALVADLRRVSVLSPDEPFTIEVYRRTGQYSASYVKRQFGGWRAALDQAGLGDRYVGPAISERMKAQVGRGMTDIEMLDRIRDVAARLGKASLSGADIEANTEVTQSQMYRRFGSVSAALRRAGIKQASHGRRYTEDEIFENLLTVWTHFGRPPTALEMDRPPSTVGKGAYLRRFGGWRKALKAFAEHASSVSEGGPTLEPDETASKGSESVREPRIAAAAAICDAGAQQQSIPTIERPRAAPRPPRDAGPEDRREPSIGLRFKVLQRDRFKCVLCGDHPARNAECVLHIDHVMPWSKGGKTREDNLRTLCATCNIGRGNRFSD